MAARLRVRQGGAGEPGGQVVPAEDGSAVVVDDNCAVSPNLGLRFYEAGGMY